MNLFLYSCVGIPLWCAIFALYFILRREKLMKESLIAKCAGSFIAVGSGGLGLTLSGKNPFLEPVFWFFVLCTLADALLEINFIPGMLVFGAGHVCLVIWLWTVVSPTWWSLVLWILAYALTALLFRKELPTLGKQTVPFLLYPALLGASLALALPLPFLMGVRFLPAAVGALSFFISDMMVAKGQLSHLDKKYHKWVMVLYWLALYLIAASLW